MVLFELPWTIRQALLSSGITDAVWILALVHFFWRWRVFDFGGSAFDFLGFFLTNKIIPFIYRIKTKYKELELHWSENIRKTTKYTKIKTKQKIQRWCRNLGPLHRPDEDRKLRARLAAHAFTVELGKTVAKPIGVTSQNPDLKTKLTELFL